MPTRTLAATPFVSVALLLTVTPVAYAQRCYEIIDLGTLGGALSGADALNDNADVAGISQTADHPSGSGEYPRACAWFGAKPVFITGTGVSVAAACAINNSGVVVGTTDEFLSKPYVAVGTDVLPLPLPPLFQYGKATDVNDAGTIVGFVVGHPTSSYRAVVWSGGAPAALPPVEGSTSVAEAINATGVVVGWSTISETGPWFHAARWSDGQPGVALPGFDPLRNSFAYDVNDVGVIVGEAYAHDGFPHAARWVNGEIEALAPFYSSAYAVNNRGDVVGFASGHGAVMWTKGEMFAMNSLVPEGSGFEVAVVRDINNKRQIAATITTATGEYVERAALLVPTLPADVDGDNVVDFADFSAVLAAYGQSGVGLDADIDASGAVDFADVAAVLATFGQSCSR